MAGGDTSLPCGCPCGELYRRNGFLPLAEDSSDECHRCRGTGEATDPFCGKMKELLGDLETGKNRLNRWLAKGPWKKHLKYGEIRNLKKKIREFERDILRPYARCMVARDTLNNARTTLPTGIIDLIASFIADPF